MIGDEFWSTGIILVWSYGDWSATAEFQDVGHAQNNSTQGILQTRYYQTIEGAIDVVIEDVRKLGIKFIGFDGGKPHLYVRGDGRDPEFPLPSNWREILAEQSERIGWTSPYNVEETPQ